MSKPDPEYHSAFAGPGLASVVQALVEEIRELYLADQIPWVVGYSGGKDSTAVLQVIWMALKTIPRVKQHKDVHVISTDTLVENPIVSQWVRKSLKKMSEAARNQTLRLESHALTPELPDRFWVNLIGRGYPAPRHKFRWCTERLKIKPSNKFILDTVRDNGEAIVILGTRKAESTQRAGRMARLEARRVRDRLSPNSSLPNSLVYSPIEDWSNDDVWIFLMQYKNPWGLRNKDLLTMYQGASADGECPLVVDTSTPSCGDSRFGCWVCTLVDKDRSMTAMIQNDDEKEWMFPLLEFRNALDIPNDRHLRDFRRMAGHVQLYKDRTIPGPYTETARHEWLRRVLEAQCWIQEKGPSYVREIELISLEELQEIRRLWVFSKHEIEDHVPRIYTQTTKKVYPGPPLEEKHTFGFEEMQLLREVCDGDDLHFELVRELLDVEYRFRSMSRRAGLFQMLEKAFAKGAYADVYEATERARIRRDVLDAAKVGDRQSMDHNLSRLDKLGEDLPDQVHGDSYSSEKGLAS